MRIALDTRFTSAKRCVFQMIQRIVEEDNRVNSQLQENWQCNDGGDRGDGGGGSDGGGGGGGGRQPTLTELVSPRTSPHNDSIHPSSPHHDDDDDFK
ncbi:hypothetical protein RB195_013110 [Necator americanus]|uniref:Uncharacterized protein n=1 Tax=Necator americanus TaxID=51031 RepID=A0ABR1DU00_NECAM